MGSNTSEVNLIHTGKQEFLADLRAERRRAEFRFVYLDTIVIALEAGMLEQEQAAGLAGLECEPRCGFAETARQWRAERDRREPLNRRQAA